MLCLPTWRTTVRPPTRRRADIIEMYAAANTASFGPERRFHVIVFVPLGPMSISLLPSTISGMVAFSKMIAMTATGRPSRSAAPLSTTVVRGLYVANILTKSLNECGWRNEQNDEGNELHERLLQCRVTNKQCYEVQWPEWRCRPDLARRIHRTGVKWQGSAQPCRKAYPNHKTLHNKKDSGLYL
jgi:hypothetical protein